MSNIYQVVFRGEIDPSVGEQKARDGIAKLFRASDAQLQQFFSGKPVVIKNQLDQNTANKYLNTLKKVGAICYVEQMPGTKAAQSAPAQPAAKPSESPPNPDTVKNSAPKAQKPAAGNVNPQQRSAAAFQQADRSANDNVQSTPTSAANQKESAGGSPWDILPAGSDMGQMDEQKEELHPDISSLSMAPVGSDIDPERQEWQEAQIDLSHMEMLPVGSDLQDEKEEIPLPEPDISHIHLAD